MRFEDALVRTSKMFGYSLYLGLGEYPGLYRSERISNDILEKSIAERKEISSVDKCRKKVLNKPYHLYNYPRIGALRSKWKRQYHIGLNSPINSISFRILYIFTNKYQNKTLSCAVQSSMESYGQHILILHQPN